MTATTMLPTTSEAVAFYERALPIVEQLLTMAREWRDRAPADEQAITAHSELAWLACRMDLRLSRQHALTADHTRALGVRSAPNWGATRG